MMAPMTIWTGLLLAFALLAASADGRALMQTPGQNGPGFTAASSSFTLLAQNSTATFVAHAQSQPTAADQCILSGNYAPTNAYFNQSGPLLVPTIIGQQAVVTLDSLPRNRYQLYNVTGTPGVTAITNSTAPGASTAPASIAFNPTSYPQTSRVLIGVFSGSDFSGRCLVDLTFTAISNSPPPATG